MKMKTSTNDGVFIQIVLSVNYKIKLSYSVFDNEYRYVAYRIDLRQFFTNNDFINSYNIQFVI